MALNGMANAAEAFDMRNETALGVLFVCTGNICRSPTAEGVLRGLAEARGLGAALRIDSCGTYGYHVGEPPDERAQASAAARGYDLTELRARKLEAVDFETFDYILAMDKGHLQQLQHVMPVTSRAQLSLLMDFVDGCEGQRVPDPYYGDTQGFERILDMIEEGCGALLDHLEQELRRADSSR
ncbi:low molecular weight protein-tyrosine-phosphatase [Limibacillus halophilus]|jgi:protein-tyrosine phosphatase